MRQNQTKSNNDNQKRQQQSDRSFSRPPSNRFNNNNNNLNNSTHNNNNAKWELPNKTARTNKNSNQFILPLNNRFNSLSVENPSNNNFITTRENPNANVIVPGVNSYSAITKVNNVKKKAIVIGDSMTRRIVTKEFNNHTTQHRTQFQSFKGATTKSLKHYIVPALAEEKPDVTIIHCGTNNLRPKHPVTPSSEEQLVDGIKQIGIRCLSAGVKQVPISGLIRRSDFEVHTKCLRTNDLLKKMCEQTGFLYICNENIPSSQLWKDGLHLSDQGVDTLANNFINFLNNINTN